MLVRPPEGTHTTFLGMPLLGDPAVQQPEAVGPPGALVRAVDVQSLPPEGGDGFAILS